MKEAKLGLLLLKLQNESSRLLGYKWGICLFSIKDNVLYRRINRMVGPFLSIQAIPKLRGSFGYRFARILLMALQMWFQPLL